MARARRCSITRSPDDSRHRRAPGLFRDEVLTEQRTQWLGTVLLAPRLSHGIFAAFSALVTALLMTLLFLGSYTRKARIAGWLVPRQGLVQVFAPEPAVVTRVAVTEGTFVHQGDPLLVLSTELRSAARGSLESEIANRLESRRQNLVKAHEEMLALAKQRANSMTARLAAVESELAQLDSSIVLQGDRVALARRTEARQRQVHEQGLISDQEYQVVSEALLEQESRLRELTRNRIAAHGERLTLQGQLQDMPLESSTEAAAVERDIAQVDQDLAETEARREIVIPAPESGTVTSVEAERGGRADPKVALMSLVPAGSPLEAHLFTPSRSIGFLKPGQRVLLRYEAYPYQKFGHYTGQVASISLSAVNPAELPTMVAGLTSLIDGAEPVYRVRVSLQRQSVVVYGKPVPLEPGMLLEADVMIERRRLIEWVLDPLYSITGKMKS